VVGVTVVVGATVVVGVSVVVVTGTVVVGATVVVVTGRSSRFLAGGTIAGLLGELVVVPTIEKSQQREPAAGLTSSVVRRL
jgi:hypothetical protein